MSAAIVPVEVWLPGSSLPPRGVLALVPSGDRF